MTHFNETTERTTLTATLEVAEEMGMFNELMNRLARKGIDAPLVRREWAKERRAVLRQRALAKLTAEERQVLGV